MASWIVNGAKKRLGTSLAFLRLGRTTKNSRTGAVFRETSRTISPLCGKGVFAENAGSSNTACLYRDLDFEP
jgi:hypothetical protein